MCKANAQSDLNLYLAHISEGTLSIVAAHFSFLILSGIVDSRYLDFVLSRITAYFDVKTGSLF